MMKRRYKILNGFVLLLLLAVIGLAITIGRTSDCPPLPAAASADETMQAVRYYCYGAPEVLALQTVERPKPGDDEILVKVHRASVNPLDWHYMRGSPYLMRLGTGLGAPEDHRMGVDFAGVVEAIGSNVAEFRPGDAVFGGADGAFGEYVLVSEQGAVALKPDLVSFDQVAATPIAALTALQALRDLGQLQPGQKVLINGASGGVGTFAVQIAKAMGAEVTGVCSERNADMVRAIGADHVIDYRKSNYTELGERYDLIVDNVGNHSLLANRDALLDSGRFILVGGSRGNWVGPLVRPLAALIIDPFVAPEYIMILAKMRKSDLQAIAAMMDDGTLVSVIDRHYALHEVAAAIAYSEKGHASGKILIDVIGGNPNE